VTTRLIEILIVVVVLLTVGVIAYGVALHAQEVHEVCVPRCAPHPVRRMDGNVCVCDMRTEYR
jgi:hypothetical protein